MRSPLAARRYAVVPAKLCVRFSVYGAYDSRTKCYGKRMGLQSSTSVQRIHCDCTVDIRLVHIMFVGLKAAKVKLLNVYIGNFIGLSSFLHRGYDRILYEIIIGRRLPFVLYRLNAQCAIYYTFTYLKFSISLLT